MNIWRGAGLRARDRLDLLDVGLLFQDVRGLDILSIALPVKILRNHITCLFDVLKDNTTLSAIFNETFRHGNIDEHLDSYPAFLNESSVPAFHVSNAAFDRDVDIEDISSIDEPCTIVTLKEKFFERNRACDGSFYVRFRVQLSGPAQERFSTAIEPEDKAFLSSIFLTEAVEFRLNERRNLGSLLSDRIREPNRLTQFSEIQYFLITDIRTEMTRAHADFRKMRRLEPGIWKRYLEGYEGFRPENSVIYHWRGAATTQSTVKEFVALATFRTPSTNSKWYYVVVIALLGALGAALQPVAERITRILWPWDHLPDITVESWQNIAVDVVTLVILLGAVWLWVSGRQRLKWLWRKCKCLVKPLNNNGG